jgi:hypothetical protein
MNMFLNLGGEMQTLRILLLAIGLLYGAGDLALAKVVNFTVQDVPGHWFDTGVNIAGTRSLAIIAPGDTVKFNQKVESRHTVTSLIWPKDAGPTEKIDQDQANTNDHQVTLTTPGLYVYVCKLHPYMLGAVIVDDKTTIDGLDIGKQLQLVVGTLPDGLLTFDSASDLALRPICRLQRTSTSQPIQRCRSSSIPAAPLSSHR